MVRSMNVTSLFAGIALLLTSTVTFADYIDDYNTRSAPRKLTEEQSKVASANYQKYCSLCHGKNREGYANDNAPSLRSRTLFESGIPHAVLRPMSYGREGTPMGGYLDEVGGPLTLDETWDLTYWLFWQSGAQRVRLSTDPVEGDIKRGAQVYKENCTACHGVNGEGVNAPALGNQSALAHNTDEVIRYAIRHGRQDTPMVGFKGRLSDKDIDNVTAFLRSKAGGWKQEKPQLKPLPTPDEYIINPKGEHPNFKLIDGKYVSAKDLNEALQKKRKMVLLDTRVTSVWQRVHIEGAVPLPYYTNLDETVKDLPKDVQIIAYCSCPRAAADHIVDQLRDKGFSNAATMYEGIFGWMHMGFPVVGGDVK